MSSQIRRSWKLHHVMILGMEGKGIFRDTPDRNYFVVMGGRPYLRLGKAQESWHICPNQNAVTDR
jgi:hypothetical protein